MRCIGSKVVVFVQQEVGQAVVPSPIGVAGDLCPLVVVARLAAHVDHAVDAGAAAQHFAARVAQSAAIEPIGWFGLIQPVGSRIADAVKVAHGNVNPVVVVFLARFDQQHTPARVCAQAIGEQAACGAAANDDVVKAEFAHGHLLVGITNSAPLAMLSGQRCMMDFCLV